MKFTFVTLFPNLIEGYFQDSILKRALQKSLFSVECLNPREFSRSKHNKVDTPAVGGGAGMIMSPQPLFDLLTALKDRSSEAHIIFATPSGKPFRQSDAKRWTKKTHLVFVSGRYEGIDERVLESFADEQICIGDYVLTGGELPSLVMCDAVARNIDGVLGNSSSLVEESFENHLVEPPIFAKPYDFNNSLAPSEFLKGNHSKIALLKSTLSRYKTSFYRPQEFIMYTKRKLYEK